MGGWFKRTFELDPGETIVASFQRAYPLDRPGAVVFVAIQIVISALLGWLSIHEAQWPALAIRLALPISLIPAVLWEGLVPPKWVITSSHLVEMNEGFWPRLFRLDEPHYIELGLLGPPRLARRGAFARHFGYGTVACDIAGSMRVLKIRHIREFESAMATITDGRRNAQRPMGVDSGGEAPMMNDQASAT